MCVIFAVFTILHGRRKTKPSEAVENEGNNEIKDKAQLHADSLARYELPTERYNDRMPELPALEPVGSELASEGLNRSSRNE
jgi:hypothetical protein